jgi:hypothetical protein
MKLLGREMRKPPNCKEHLYHGGSSVFVSEGRRNSLCRGIAASQ